jgi:hypothetical protein
MNYESYCNNCCEKTYDINSYYCNINAGACENCLSKGYNKKTKVIDPFDKWRPKNLPVDKLVPVYTKQGIIYR